jgi:hypothetical protein
MGSCFVIMGFGEKTDFQSNPQRVLNLNRTYDNIIKPAVTEAGHTCVRADEIIHSTVIDKPMYDNLFEADLVIADLSTSNANTIYQLGVRHTLRPHRTIVMAENNFFFPFDINHLGILKYEHLGRDIAFGEVLRVRGILKEKIASVMSSPEIDSPVYLFMPTLKPASIAAADPAVASAKVLPPAASAPQTDPNSFAYLLESFRTAKSRAIRPADWKEPLELLTRLKTMQPTDPYILQQMALAIYKHEQPDKMESLIQAKMILRDLAPQTSSDAESIGLWGAIHKRLWEEFRRDDDLNEAIQAYARAYYIKNDYYNGINYAFMLNVRAFFSTGEEAWTDRVLARRVRKDVLVICDRLLQAVPPPDRDEVYWIEATKVEALFGSGRRDEAEQLQSQIIARQEERARSGDQVTAYDPTGWMEESLANQIDKLAKLLP